MGSVDDSVHTAFEVLKEAFRHKNILLRAFVSFLLDQGTYDYKISLDDLENLDHYGLSYTLHEDKVLDISVTFPQDIPHDEAGTVH